MEHNIILASASPRRKELLSSLGLTFEVFPAKKDEIMKGDTHKDIALNLAVQKATEVFEEHKTSGLIVIGADTIVVCDDEILGKPKDEEDARRMLKLLSRHTHEVITGVCIKRSAGETRFTKRTAVSFYKITDAEINDYLKFIDPQTGKAEWADKAGAYAIQGYIGTRFVRSIKGDYNNVVGLPISDLYLQLKSQGII